MTYKEYTELELLQLTHTEIWPVKFECSGCHMNARFDIDSIVEEFENEDGSKYFYIFCCNVCWRSNY